MATVRIPPVLRPLTSGHVRIDAAGATLAEALEQVFGEYPELRSRMIDEGGALQRFVNVYVDEEDVRTLAGLDTLLGETSQVIVLPAMAGG